MATPELSETEARAAAEWAARTCYGKLVAQLTAQFCDVTLAEDVLADAFASALTTWPERGVPDKPEAWLMKAAARKAVDAARKANTAARHARATRPLMRTADITPSERDGPLNRDRRLELMFLCAHPAIPTPAHTALMLQTVLGFTAEDIAAATLESPAAVGQRLSRAKRLLAKGHIPFAIPPDHIRHERIAAVLRAIYATYTSGWENIAGGMDPVIGLATEAEWLARCLTRQVPDDAEVKGLLALILYCESRRKARQDSAERYIPLTDQDTALWDEPRIAEATALLTEAGKMQAPGRFQLEAAIQAVHAARRQTGRTDWTMICKLYERLQAFTDSMGARIGYAATLLQLGKVDEAADLLNELPHKRISQHAPFWAVRGHAMKTAGDMDEACENFRHAANLTQNKATREWLLAQASER
ncbi:MAG: RNA polymerase subunit sigma-70 [Alphaproteobacteria bacterium]|nr:RNA polymerase subunit sigma-70 [Alphaproteobacteria bacterium]